MSGRSRAVLAVLAAGAAAAGCSGGHGHAASATTATTARARAAQPASDGVKRLVAQAQALRGLRLRHPLRVTRLDRRELGSLLRRLNARDENPAGAAADDDALHLLGVLGPRQSLHAVSQAELAGQVAGLYDPHTKRLYLVKTGGGGVPPSVIVHETTHALQDQSFDLQRGPFAARPHDDDGALATQALVEGDATDVQERYLARAGTAAALLEGLSALGELAQTPSPKVPPFLQRDLLFPYLAGQRFVQALRAHGGERRVDAAFRHPPQTTAAVLDPARYLAGDAPAARVPVPPPPAGWARELHTSFGAEDLAALTGKDALASAWRGGELVVDRRGRERSLLLRLAARRPAAVAAALRASLPGRVEVTRRGGLVTAGGVLVR